MTNIGEKAISILEGNLNSDLSYLITTVPVVEPPVPEVVAWVVVDVSVVQSPPSKWQSVLFASSLQTPFATNSVWEQSL